MGGVKNDQYSEMAELQSTERQAIEEKKLNDMKNYKIPNIEDLEKKYPILYPTVDKGNMAREIRNIILEGFDSWNKGFTDWSSWVDIAYKTDAFAVKGTQDHKSMSEYKTEMQANSTNNVKRIYFDNMLINYNWAAIHYRYNIDTNDETQKDAGDRMQFLRFEETDDGLKIGETWIK